MQNALPGMCGDTPGSARSMERSPDEGAPGSATAHVSMPPRMALAAVQGNPAQGPNPVRPEPEKPPAPALAAFQLALAACSAPQQPPGWPSGLDAGPAPNPTEGPAAPAQPLRSALRAVEEAQEAGGSAPAASRAHPAQQQAPDQAPQARNRSAAAAEYAAALRRFAQEPPDQAQAPAQAHAHAPEPPRVSTAAAAYAAALRAAAPEQAPERDQARRWQAPEPAQPAAAAARPAAPNQAVCREPDHTPPCPVRCRADAERVIRAFPRQADACAFADACNCAAAAAEECGDQRPERSTAAGADAGAQGLGDGEATGAVQVDEIVRVRCLHLCRLCKFCHSCNTQLAQTALQQHECTTAQMPSPSKPIQH